MSAAASILDRSRRAPRTDHHLDASPGLYALFLRSGAKLPDLEVPEEALLYIGKADGAGGLRARCHFNGGTRNHSPRKSFAAILRNHLSLVPIPVLNKRVGAYKTWQLELTSERKLDAWMHKNLMLSIYVSAEPRALEAQLIRENAPPLNLKECVQGEQQRHVYRLRSDIEAAMRARVGSVLGDPR
ncbi:MAG: GIY-YIG nuclease family protein [Sphingomonas sp.]